MCARKCTKTQGVCVKLIPSQSDQTEYNYCLTGFAGVDGEGSWDRRGPQCDVQMKLASANAAATIRRDRAVKHGVVPRSHRALELCFLPRGPMIFRVACAKWWGIDPRQSTSAVICSKFAYSSRVVRASEVSSHERCYGSMCLRDSTQDARCIDCGSADVSLPPQGPPPSSSVSWRCRWPAPNGGGSALAGPLQRSKQVSKFAYSSHVVRASKVSSHERCCGSMCLCDSTQDAPLSLRDSTQGGPPPFPLES